MSHIDYADDLVLLSHSELAMNEMPYRLKEQGDKIGLRISANKTKCMWLSTKESCLASRPATILLGQAQVQQVYAFDYLGITLTHTGKSGPNIAKRVKAARSSLSVFRPLMVRSEISRSVKRSIVKRCVFPVLFYGCETWRLNACDVGRLRALFNDCRRAILGASKWDHLRNVEVEQLVPFEDPLALVVARKVTFYRRIWCSNNKLLQGVLSGSVNWRGNPGKIVPARLRTSWYANFTSECELTKTASGGSLDPLSVVCKSEQSLEKGEYTRLVRATRELTIPNSSRTFKKDFLCTS